MKHLRTHDKIALFVFAFIPWIVIAIFYFAFQNSGVDALRQATIFVGAFWAACSPFLFIYFTSMFIDCAMEESSPHGFRWSDKPRLPLVP